MMVALFWVLAAALLALAAWLVLPALLGRLTADEVDRGELNRDLQRKELAELRTALAAGELDDSTYRQACGELEYRVLEIASCTGNGEQAEQDRLARPTAAALMIAVPVMAVLTYFGLGGGASAIDHGSIAAAPGLGSPHADVAAVSAEAPPIDQLAERLAQRLQTNPEDTAGWLLLARSYHHLGRDVEARGAYARARDQGGEDQELAAILEAQETIKAGTRTVDAVTPSAEIETRAAANRTDGHALLELARAERRRGDFAAASAAFAEAHALLPESADLLADYADALAVAQGRRLDGKPIALIERALQIEPDHPKAIWLAASAALERGERARAKTYWQRLQRLLPDDSPDKPVIERNLAALGDEVVDEVREDGAGAVVRGRVEMSREMRARVSDDDTLFIFARAVEGPPMPLAVLRARVRDLPLEFSLDDSLALQPQLKLSSFDQVMLGARISRSGTVAQKPGEPRVDVGPVPTRGGPAQLLLIDQARR